MAPQKRKASTKAPKSPPAKKAKREVDPVQMDVDTVIEAFTMGTLGEELPEKVVKMVTAVAPDALSSYIEEREGLEVQFAQLVGTALKQGAASLTAKAKAAGAALKSREEEVEELGAKVDEAIEVKNAADAVVQTKTAAEMAARDAKNAAQEALVAQTEEEGSLGATKLQFEAEKADLEFAIECMNGEAPSAKDAKRLATILKDAGAPEAMIVGGPKAIGKDTDLDKMFIGEAGKILGAKLAEKNTMIANWDTHTEEMAVKTKQITDEVTQLTTVHEESDAELTEAQQALKTAQQGIRAAEAAKKGGVKAVDKAKDVSMMATREETASADVVTTYDNLYNRSNAPAPAPVFEDDEEMPQPVFDAEDPMEAVAAA